MQNVTTSNASAASEVSRRNAPAAGPGRSGPPDAAEEAVRRRITHELLQRNLPREHGFEPVRVEGTLPADLRGTLLRNGPGLFEHMGTRYDHPFVGDGAITAVRLDGTRDGALGFARVTESRGLLEERAAGRQLYGNSVGRWRRLRNAMAGRLKNIANTSVVVWQGRVFALVESSPPTELSAEDLGMIGETDLGGVVIKSFSAHPHRVAARRATYNFGVEYGRVNKLHLYELPDSAASSESVVSPEAAPARRLGTIDLPFGPMLHDFIATEHHLLFFVPPTPVSVPRALLGFGGFTDLFGWKPELGVQVIAVPLDGPGGGIGEPIRFTADPFYQWHFSNAFSRSATEVVVDYVRYPDFSTFRTIGSAEEARVGEGRFCRATLDLQTRQLRNEERLGRTCEFPRVHPGSQGRDYRYSWLALDDFGGIGRLDVESGALVTHAMPAEQWISEPVFVPRGVDGRPAGQADGVRGDEADGHVLALGHDARLDRAFVAVFDGRRIEEGPVARVWFDHFVPATFHGNWLPAAR